MESLHGCDLCMNVGTRDPGRHDSQESWFSRNIHIVINIPPSNGKLTMPKWRLHSTVLLQRFPNTWVRLGCVVITVDHTIQVTRRVPSLRMVTTYAIDETCKCWEVGSYERLSLGGDQLINHTWFHDRKVKDERVKGFIKRFLAYNSFRSYRNSAHQYLSTNA